MTTRANDRQVGGVHYQGGNYQHWDWVADNFGRGYFQGQITRYVSRWQRKNGVEDLLKAIHYLDKLEELHNLGKLMEFNSAYVPKNTWRLMGICDAEKQIFYKVATYSSMEELAEVRPLILALLEQTNKEKENQK